MAMFGEVSVLADSEDAAMPARKQQDGSRAFLLHGPGGTLSAFGQARALDAGPLAALGDRARACFAQGQADPEGAPLLVGALPFDPAAPFHLYQPARLADADMPRGGRLPPILSARADPAPEDFTNAVRKALVAIDAGAGDPVPLRKVVLARSLVVDAAGAIDPLALFDRLGADPNVTRFATPLPSGTAMPRHLVGATPELLVSRRGETVTSLPLAGSMPLARPDGGELLLESGKDRREHALVVEAIADLLAPLCRSLSVPATPELRTTRTMWHLGTRIEGELKDGEAMPAAALAALLHPTPAVGGTPRDAAIDLIRALEPAPRGFYAGAVGWSDAQGDGDWYVALRCADIAGPRARVHAGAGIVAGSDPRAALAETSAKFRAILDALGIDEGDGELANLAAQ